MVRNKKQTTLTALTTVDWAIYNYLKEQFKMDPKRWLSKKEILEDNADILKGNGETSHDICSTLNLIRLKLNKASHEGQLSHLILLHNGSFKIAADMEEAKAYLYKDYKLGIKRIVRYYENMKVLRRDGQGKLIDCKGNVITEESLAKRFNDVFNVS